VWLWDRATDAEDVAKSAAAVGRREDELLITAETFAVTSDAPIVATNVAARSGHTSGTTNFRAVVDAWIARSGKSQSLATTSI
jgi:hypothetical protein